MAKNERIIPKIIENIRKNIRTRTSGPLPAMKTQHPIRGLIHDVQRMVRRRIREIFG